MRELKKTKHTYSCDARNTRKLCCRYVLYDKTVLYNFRKIRFKYVFYSAILASRQNLTENFKFSEFLNLKKINWIREIPAKSCTSKAGKLRFCQTGQTWLSWHHHDMKKFEKNRIIPFQKYKTFFWQHCSCCIDEVTKTFYKNNFGIYLIPPILF